MQRNLNVNLRSYLYPYALSLLAEAQRLDVSRDSNRDFVASICHPGHRHSRFVEHLARKYDRFDLLQRDPASFWAWYLGEYAVERGSLRVPLSRSDLIELATLDDDGRSIISRVAAVDVSDAYAWGIDESRRLFVEDCLVTDAQAAHLVSVPAHDHAAFPLSTFMIELHRRHSLLRRVSPKRSSGRISLYGLIMLLAVRSPHFLRYMPVEWIRRMLAETDGRSLFETTIADHLEGIGFPAATYEKLVVSAGFDVARQTFQTRYDGHRILAGGRVVARSTPVQVQLIGPLNRIMGLGESSRRLLKALHGTGYTINAVDYDIRSSKAGGRNGHRAAIRSADLNILHLNAEEIPEAMAYLPDAFSGTRNVAVPYWELDRPSHVHRLGLDLVDEVWVASQFLEGVFRSHRHPVHRIGMSSPDVPRASLETIVAVRHRFKISPRSFVYLTTSDALSWIQRKNPLATIAAFKSAFVHDEDVVLVIKTHNLASLGPDARHAAWAQVRATCSADTRIVLVDERLDAQTQQALLQAADCLVSLHRAEGLGLDLLDAMRIGLPVVATAYSGNVDFCKADTSWPVDFDLVPVQPHDYCFVEVGQVWAQPRLDTAISALRDVFHKPASRRDKVMAGQALVQADFSSERLISVLRRNIARLIEP